MENQLQIFNNEEFGEVRTVLIDNEPWFIAHDVCEALEIGNSRQALTRLDEDEKASVILNDGSQNRHMSTVNEYGLYNLVLSSRKPEAKAFRRWITHDVIPQIRQTGSYSLTDSYMITDPVARAQKWIEEEQERQRLATINVQQAIALEAAAPKVEYHDSILQSDCLYTATEVAADYGWSAIKLNKFLLIQHIQYKRSGRYYLYSYYLHKGYAASRTVLYANDTKSRTVLCWTPAGREYINRRLAKVGVYPLPND